MTTPYASEAFIHQLLGKALAAHASDIHLKVGQPPGARVRGDLVYFRVDKLGPQDTEAAARVLLLGRSIREQLTSVQEYTASYAVSGLGRFRINLYRQRDSLSIVLRSIPLKIPTFDELGLPPTAKNFAEQARGLVFVVGDTSSGKTSTLAAIIGHINTTVPKHVITIENPIEFVHEDNRASIGQREIGVDTADVITGLRTAMRQDADVLVAAEWSDHGLLDVVLDAAECGHLVLCSLSSPDVSRALRYLLREGTATLRERLSETLHGIIAQRLMPKRDGSSLTLATEVLVANASVRDAIRNPEGNPPLKELMDKGATPYGMQTFESSMRQLVAQGMISKDAAKGF